MRIHWSPVLKFNSAEGKGERSSPLTQEPFGQVLEFWRLNPRVLHMLRGTPAKTIAFGGSFFSVRFLFCLSSGTSREPQLKLYNHLWNMVVSSPATIQTFLNALQRTGLILLDPGMSSQVTLPHEMKYWYSIDVF